MKILEWLKRNPCKECKYYVKDNNTCQSKKCSSNNPYITRFDKLFCEPYEPQESEGKE